MLRARNLFLLAVLFYVGLVPFASEGAKYRCDRRLSSPEIKAKRALEDKLYSIQDEISSGDCDDYFRTIIPSFETLSSILSQSAVDTSVSDFARNLWTRFMQKSRECVNQQTWEFNRYEWWVQNFQNYHPFLDSLSPTHAEFVHILSECKQKKYFVQNGVFQFEELLSKAKFQHDQIEKQRLEIEGLVQNIYGVKPNWTPGSTDAGGAR